MGFGLELKARAGSAREHHYIRSRSYLDAVKEEFVAKTTEVAFGAVRA